MAWLIFLVVVAVPFLINYITTSFFHRHSAKKSLPKHPPTVPYWIPGLFHGLGLLSKPSTYFALIIKKYGNHAPFVLKTGRVSYLVVRSPEQCGYLLRDGPDASINDAKSDLVEVYSKLFGTTREAAKCYNAMGTGDSEGDTVHLAHVAVHLKYLEDEEGLKALTDLFISVFRRNMSNKMFQTSSCKATLNGTYLNWRC